MARRLSPGKNPPEADNVYTPEILAQRIVNHFQPFGDCLEPCSGGGAFVRAMQRYGVSSVTSLDIKEGLDFFDLPGELKFDFIITNYPWSKYRKFLNHSMKVARNIITLGPTNHVLGSYARMNDIEREGFFIREICRVERPKEWASSGFDYSAIRLTRQPGGCIITKL